MEPREDSKSADFDRSGRRKLQAPKIRVVLGGNVHGPDRAASGDQAGEALFPANTSQVALLWSQLARFRNGDDRNELGLRLNVALAPSVQIDVVSRM